ncbi:unnamed protein product [Brassica rapa]|uniref:MORF/ORRM1/DAG-like MORF domain-containing protein n=1 Tax=Brassica campestris TaxID=3711 RepID=A0A3P6A9G4_BRACM|nr:unnamed protein product [Brassica rapa]VDC84094.1 unnamed protein product [Brassica rapa]
MVSSSMMLPVYPSPSISSSEASWKHNKKFTGIPGVLFVLPDSYVDPEYKDYGAELFVNGEVVPRPPER